MKRILITVGLVFCVVLLQAKSWKMTYESHGLIADKVNTMKLTTYVNPGDGGANQIWDFSELPLTKDFKGHVENSVYSENFNEVLNTNVVLKEFNNQFYFRGNNDLLELHGVAVNNKMLMKFDKPFVKMKYPFGFEDFYSGTYTGDYYSGNTVGKIDGTYAVEGDGYGSLVLPGNITVDDVLRVKTSRSYIRTVNDRSYKVNITTYRWYESGTRFPLLVFIENEYESSNGKSNFSYQAAYRSDIENLSQTTAIESEVVENVFDVAPNPIKDFTTIYYSVMKECNVRLEVYNINGELVRTLINENKTAGPHTFKLSPEEHKLPSGNYYLNLTRGSDFSTKKLLIQ